MKSKCLECGASLDELTNEHLTDCCGLTLQEYALRHRLPLELVVPARLLNVAADPGGYPPVTGTPDRRARLVLSAVRAAGVWLENGDFVEIPGEVRRLEQLFWCFQALKVCKFQFRQEYIFNRTTHRVVANNLLRARSSNVLGLPVGVESLSPMELLLYTAVLASFNSFVSAGYLFLRLADDGQGRELAARLEQEFNVGFEEMKPFGKDCRLMLRTKTLEDSNSLLGLLRHRLEEIPGAVEHLYPATPVASVTRQLKFDSAHFITDHPGACANMHGGRYELLVTVTDRVDPYTGFVMDYAYLKEVVDNRVIARLDHAHLNLVDSSLSWRSSTESLCVFVWEQLLDYIPSLDELNIYETEKSYCTFAGPSLEEWQAGGRCILPSHFDNPQLGRSILRRQSGLSSCPVRLTPVGGKPR